MPLVVAAFLANTVYAAFEELEQRLKSVCTLLDPRILQEKLQQLEPDLKCPSEGEMLLDRP